MIKPVLKSLSFAFVAFGAVAASAAEEGPVQNFGAMAASCPAPVDIVRGWEAQQRLLDERLAAKGLAVTLPGTIISPPLPDFGSDRAAQAAKTTNTGSSSPRPASKSQPLHGGRM